MELLLSRAVLPFSEHLDGYAFNIAVSHARVTTPIHQWLNRGKQRRAVAQALTHPQTQAALLTAARGGAPHIQLRDVWAIVQDFVKRGLVSCLNPQTTIGKFYYWTDRGRTAAQRAFNLRLPCASTAMDWTHYAFLVRAPLRRAVLAEVARIRGRPEFRTATQIRKDLRGRMPAGINSVLRALKQLADANLIAQRLSQGHKVYRLTLFGKAALQAQNDNSERCERRG
jgi:hypothetical protein